MRHALDTLGPRTPQRIDFYELSGNGLNEHMTEKISRKLLEILACPVCRRDVKLKGRELICVRCGRRYPLVAGVPHMLPDELR